jgi:uncharacterized Zn finger protein (UPF0148 family)
MASCDDCSRCFRTADALQDHKRATHHCFCRHCDRFFQTSQGLDSHRNSIHNYYCPDCNKRFDFGNALELHQRSTGHAFCHICQRHFDHESAAENHRQALHTAMPASISSTRRSVSRIVKDGWGSRPNFQASYRLQMTSEDLAEGNAILKAMQEDDQRH